LPSEDLLPTCDWLASIVADCHVAVGVSRLTDGKFVAVNNAFENVIGLAREDGFGHANEEILGAGSYDGT
jgi:PAS domain-containing protein